MSGFISCPYIAGNTYSSEAAQFFARLASQPTDTRKGIYNTMIASLVASGVWAKLDALYIFAAAASATALTNLKNSSYGASVVAAPSFAADSGYTCVQASSQAVDTNYNPSTAGGNWVQDSAAMFCWIETWVHDPVMGHGATGSSGTGHAFMWLGEFTTTFIGINEDGNGLTVANANRTGLFTTSRQAAGSSIAYRNAASLGTDSTASQAMKNDTIRFFEENASFGAGLVMGGGMGAGLSAQNVSDLYAAIHTYLQTVAGVA